MAKKRVGFLRKRVCGNAHAFTPALILLLENGKAFAEAKHEVVYAAGCSVIIKSPSGTSFSALELARFSLAADIPSAVIHTVPKKNMEATWSQHITSLERSSASLALWPSGTYLDTSMFARSKVNQRGHNRMEVAHNNTFGPRATIVSLGAEVEAGQLDNATEYGLSL
ncbi:hypothetical protein LX32DRAFT_657224 [Colletotrichum zoysiae]|uniref:Aldehyde dehydrogenase domain-containing protein n=1 Tax=Colletotrichum zoysiae TaxID=1216348 RepID=A0AAD9H799_9PEZI|nr:hypothetical protein LX32DRAFT_657224 [Colletotrichum zoysiae]